jgi:hypothetical protein
LGGTVKIVALMSLQAFPLLVNSHLPPTNSTLC